VHSASRTPASSGALRRRYAELLGALFLGIVVFSPQLQAAIDPIKFKALRQQAEFHEQQGEWDKACAIYESILRLDRNPEIQARYQICLRRYWQVRRHSDFSYRKEVLSLDYGQSLRLYTMIRDTLLDNALDRKKADPGKLFQKGLEEFDNALGDPFFLQQYLPAVKPHEIRVFRNFLKKTWLSEAKLTRSQALKQLRDVALAAQNVLQLNCNVVLMEFACGACYALDDYTLYLTPNQLRELCDSLRGEYAGVGLTFRVNDNKLVINEIIPYSPAGEVNNPPLAKDDQVVSIDKKPSAQMTPETAQELLEGPVGGTVELEVYSPAMPMRIVTLRRRTMFVPSVSYHMKNDRVGYLHVACFQDTTVQEIEDALAALAKADMKALILDIRSNGGGLFEAAIDVARRFLATGIIASTQNSDPKFSTVFHARNPHALTLPLVVLIDGDTASAAEVLAGALKDNKRGRLVGQTTFGKGCTQCILKLPAAPGGVPTGGMRLTVARFFSPEGLPYTGRGVVPHVPAERLLMGSMSGPDQQMDAAMLEAQRLLDAAR
jgi:carboxyl-terminal processing protease